MTAEDITAVVREIAPAVTSSRIQRICQPTPFTVTLQLWGGHHRIREARRTLTLLLSVEPDLDRIHFITRRLPNPSTPSGFCQFLRAHIQGAQIEEISQIDDDRIVRFQLRTRAGPGALVAELIGRNADLLVLDAEETVRAALRVGAARIGHPYTTPRRGRPYPQAEKPYPQAETTAPPHGLERNGEDPPPPRPTAFPISTSLEARHEAHAQALERKRLQNERLRDLRKQIKKMRRHIDGLRGDLEKADRYKDYARYGDLLKANLGTVAKGQHAVTVIDYFDPLMPELVIPLDPARSPQANLEDYFRKYRKYVTAEREGRPRLNGLERELQRLQKEVVAVLQETWQPPASDLARSACAADRGGAPSGDATLARPRRPLRPGPFRRFTSSDGLPVYVGKNAKENEELTFGLAHSDDLWLHAHGVPGSHVIVRLERGADIPLETLRDAATLALLYSDLKKAGKGEVIYAKRKYVRKLKGQPPGTVSVTQEKSMYIHLDRARLQRLKDRQGR